MSAEAEPSSLSVKRDAWLSDKLGRSAWRVEQNNSGEPLARLESSDRLFAYAKVAAADVAPVWRLTDKGFRLVDTALTFEGVIAPAKVGAAVRFAKPDDRDAVARIAGTVFRYSRFHLDPLISTEAAHAIKAEWADNYFAGKRGDGMVVAERDGRVVAFLQLLWESESRLVIDLIGVDASSQGQGIGRDMIRFAAVSGTGDARRPQQIKVGTQAANAPSVRLYESLGLRLSRAQYVLHFHGQSRV